jgi:hypothetical protein
MDAEKAGSDRRTQGRSPKCMQNKLDEEYFDRYIAIAFMVGFLPIYPTMFLVSLFLLYGRNRANGASERPRKRHRGRSARVTNGDAGSSDLAHCQLSSSGMAFRSSDVNHVLFVLA